MIPTDKVQHFAICAIAAMCMMILMRIICALPAVAFVSATISSIALGVGKEYGDHCNPYSNWDWYDLLADTIGALVGSAIGLILWA